MGFPVYDHVCIFCYWEGNTVVVLKKPLQDIMSGSSQVAVKSGCTQVSLKNIFIGGGNFHVPTLQIFLFWGGNRWTPWLDSILWRTSQDVLKMLLEVALRTTWTLSLNMTTLAGVIVGLKDAIFHCLESQF